MDIKIQGYTSLPTVFNVYLNDIFFKKIDNEDMFAAKNKTAYIRDKYFKRQKNKNSLFSVFYDIKHSINEHKYCDKSYACLASVQHHKSNVRLIKERHELNDMTLTFKVKLKGVKHVNNNMFNSSSNAIK